MSGCRDVDKVTSLSYKMGLYTSYVWGYNPYKWLYEWVTGLKPYLQGFITPFKSHKVLVEMI